MKSGGELYRPRKLLRLNHLEYLQVHQDKTEFGGLALSEQNAPETMVIVTEFTDKAAAGNFIKNELYTASGEVSESVAVRTWAQVQPEAHLDALIEEIEKERSILK